MIHVREKETPEIRRRRNSSGREGDKSVTSLSLSPTFLTALLRLRGRLLLFLVDDAQLERLLVRGPPGRAPDVVLHLAAPLPGVPVAHAAQLDGAFVLVVHTHEGGARVQGAGAALLQDLCRGNDRA